MEKVIPGEKIVIYPNPVIQTPTRKVTKDDDVISISKRLVNLMVTNGGVGIAANQCGYDLSICVVEDNKDYVVFINPEILEREEEIEFKEGCLSFPGVIVDTKRHSKIKVAYDTLEGERKTRIYEGFTAIIIQHEIDHLEGKTFVDDLSSLKKDIVIRKLKKWKKKLKS